MDAMQARQEKEQAKTFGMPTLSSPTATGERRRSESVAHWYAIGFEMSAAARRKRRMPLRTSAAQMTSPAISFVRGGWPPTPFDQGVKNEPEDSAARAEKGA